MSEIDRLSLKQFRNLSFDELSFSKGINLIQGANGSGKTSLLEAIYHLSAGHSFRTTLLADIITHGHDFFVVRARFHNGETRAIQKTKTGQIKVKQNHTLLNSTSVLAKDLPILLIYQSIFQIIDAGPNERRRLLDWGLFHVEHDYFNIWKQYKTALSHRNALLKAHASQKECDPWTQQLIKLGCSLTRMRESYLEGISPLFATCLSQLTELTIGLQYQNGYLGLTSAPEILSLYEKSFDKDRQYGYTQYGPHKADLLIKHEQYKARKSLSRGQQKLILMALKIAQSQYLNHSCIYLLDDISAEIDKDNLEKMVSLILGLKGQVFMTELVQAHSILQQSCDKMFHVKHGHISLIEKANC